MSPRPEKREAAGIHSERSVTRNEKIERAKQLRADGLPYREIGERLGVHLHTAFRWLNPDYEEAQRQVARGYKDRNREAMRVYGREYRRTHKGKCSSCGGEMERQHDGGVCLACREEEVHRRAEMLERWWAEGLTLKEIASKLGLTVNHVGSELNRLRKKGYNLPYRRKQRAS